MKIEERIDPKIAATANPAPQATRNTPKKSADSGSLWGIALAFGGVIAALLYQGGELSDLFQWSSAILLLAGTAGAVLITNPVRIVKEALASAAELFSPKSFDSAAAVEQITALSRRAMRQGLASLELELDSIQIPFLREAILMASDGSTPEDVGNKMRLETRLTRLRFDRQARVFETAGGYAPTLGILGAVLGLIQVMKHLGEMSAVGHGIAAAFVSTVYGLALANLILLPIAGRLRATAAEKIAALELLTDGVIYIMQKLHPLAMEAQLSPYLVHAGDARTEPAPAKKRLKVAVAAGA